MDFHQLLVFKPLGNNELWRIALFFTLLFMAVVVSKICRQFLLNAAEKMQQRVDHASIIVMRALASSVGLVMLPIGLKLGLACLVLPANIVALGNTVVSLLFVAAVGWFIYWLVDIVDYWLGSVSTRAESKMGDMLAPMVRKSLRVVVVVLVLLQMATTLSDKPLTSLIAGLGLSSLAIALAAQDSLKNLFGSVVIFADKPFDIGDRILVDRYDGNVEEVGFRSTRIRTTVGHIVTVPNADMANKAVENITRRPYIKKEIVVGVVYGTTPEKLARAIDLLKEILNRHPGWDPKFPPRVFLHEFADSALNIKVIYWYFPPQYWEFIAFNEKLLKEIFERFTAEGIDFAYPSQTVYLAKG